jgi:hypothetical protein
MNPARAGVDGGAALATLREKGTLRIAISENQKPW